MFKMFCIISFSIFQGLMGDKQRDVVKTVSSTIAAVFSEGAPECHAGSSEFSVVVVRKVEYLEVLTENFKLGEAALKQQLPVGEAGIILFY